MKRQRGITFVGMIFVAALIVFGAVIGLKLIPAYIEFATVQNHLRDLARAPDTRDASPREIQQAFNRRAQIDNISVISGQDIDVATEGGSVVLTAEYSTKIKLVGNVSACIDFTASSN